jgi:hypothetical protein
MADEISVTTKVAWTKGEYSLSRSKTFYADWAGEHVSDFVQDIGTATHELIVIPAEIATAGVSVFHSMSTSTATATYVSLGTDNAGTFVPFTKLLSGEAYPARLATNAVYAQSSNEAVKLRCSIGDK